MSVGRDKKEEERGAKLSFYAPRVARRAANVGTLAKPPTVVVGAPVAPGGACVDVW